MACSTKQLEWARNFRIRHPDRVKEAKRKSRAKHRDKCNAYSKRYRAAHPEIYREASRRQRIKHKDKIRERDRLKVARRRKNHPTYRLLENLRRRVNAALHTQFPKSERTVALLGCSVESFKLYLESKFEIGMSWDNYGRYGWQIDHIVPCALFDLSKFSHQRRCFHFSNLQPMWAHENRKKAASCSVEVIA